MESLRHVLWIGGPAGLGKTTVSRRIARRHGLRWYNADAHTWEHRDRAIREGHAGAIRWEAMSPYERHVDTTPAEMMEVSIDFDRWPITNLDQKIVSFVRKYCRRLEKNIDDGAGLYFYGEVGSGKTSLAMVVAKEVLRERRSLAIFSGPDLLAKIVSTYEDRSPDTYLGLMELLGSVDFLILEDLAVAKQSDWRLEQLYAVINRRYQDQRPLLVTADVGAPELLGDHIGHRTGSRILEMCEAIPFLDGDHRVKATTPEDVRLAS